MPIHSIAHLAREDGGKIAELHMNSMGKGLAICEPRAYEHAHS